MAESYEIERRGNGKRTVRRSVYVLRRAIKDAQGLAKRTGAVHWVRLERNGEVVHVADPEIMEVG